MFIVSGFSLLELEQRPESRMSQRSLRHDSNISSFMFYLQMRLLQDIYLHKHTSKELFNFRKRSKDDPHFNVSLSITFPINSEPNF